MARPFLFGGSSGSQSQNKYLVEFRAGKMTMKGKMVHPDKRKGMVYVHQTEDSLMHFCWKDRNTGVVEDDLIIFPDDAEFKKVSQCTTGRVFVLKFKLSSRRCFYWMQEPKGDKDEEYRGKVNEFLNNPPVPGSGGHGSSGQGGGLQSELSNLGGDDIQNLLNNMSHSQLVQLLGTVESMGGMSNLNNLLSGVRPSSGQSSTATPFSRSSRTADSERASTTPTAASATSATSTSSPATAVATAAAAPTVVTPTAASATTTPPPTATPIPAAPATVATVAASAANSANIQLSDLQDILSGLSVPAGQSGGEAAAGVGVDLSQAITAEALQPLLNNQELMERVRSLLPNTEPFMEEEEEVGPPGTNVPATLKSTIQSPQFQHALSVFSAALQSGQLGPLMQQFGMAQEVVDAANSGNMDAFVTALQSSQAAASKESASVKKEDKDEDMALD